MNDKIAQLPCEQLHHAPGGIPWPALRTFAEALITNRALAQDLFDAYDRAYEESSRPFTYADFYVAAILRPGGAPPRRRAAPRDRRVLGR